MGATYQNKEWITTPIFYDGLFLHLILMDVKKVSFLFVPEKHILSKSETFLKVIEARHKKLVTWYYIEDYISLMRYNEDLINQWQNQIKLCIP